MPELSGINSCINHFSGIPFLRLCFRGNKPVGFCISNIFSNPRVLSFGLQQVKSLELVSLDLITQAKIPEFHLHWGGVPLEVRSHRANGHPNIKRGGDVEWVCLLGTEISEVVSDENTRALTVKSFWRLCVIQQGREEVMGAATLDGCPHLRTFYLPGPQQVLTVKNQEKSLMERWEENPR